VALNCELIHHVNVNSAAEAFGVQDVTTAPTQISATGWLNVNGGTTVSVGVLQALTTTVATSIVSVTNSTITTDFGAHLSILVQQPSGTASVLNVMVSTNVAARTVTVKKGSFCTVSPTS
jgi:hypothetical protein